MICVQSVKVSPSSVTLKEDEWYYNVSVEVCPSNATNKSVTWHSDDTCVATVNPTYGYIYAKSEGTAKIYATAADGSGKRDYLTVTVSKSIKVSSVILNRSSLSLEKDECYTLSATVLPENATNKTLSWSSSNPGIATVSNGVVRAISKGSAVITATATDGTGKSACCFVTVTDDILVRSITVNPSSKTMETGDSVYLHATVCPTNATNKSISWCSSNTSVATVNENTGLVYAKKAGTATIYANAKDGSDVSGKCVITVKDPVLVEDIILNKTVLNLFRGDTYYLCATICPSDAKTKTVRWTSSNPCVASVDECSGRVTAKSAGKAIIYANAQDGSGVKACCTVNVKQTVNCCVEETPRGKSLNKVVGALFNGAHTIQHRIMNLYGGQNLELFAYYESTQLACGDLGSGWYHNYEKRLVINGNEAYVFNNPSTYSRFVADSNCCNVFTCTSPDKKGYVLIVDCSKQYPYTINYNSQRTEYYNSSGLLAKIVDHQGFETLITYSGNKTIITDTVSCKKIYLEKDACGRVIKVYDDASRQATLTYKDNLLVKIRDVNGNSLSFEYDEEGRIKSGTDAMNIRYFENTYDEYGRVITLKDALGNITNVTYDGNKRITTDRNGNQSICIYNNDGLLISYTDENGNTRTFEYDERCNIIRETDAKGNSVVKVYNNFNKPTEVTDKNGNKTYYYYDSAGNVIKIRYPAIGGAVPEETFEYNSRNQLVKHKDCRGTVTVYTYDANGMPASKKVGSRNPVLFNYQNGLLISQTDAMGNTTRYGYNAIGQLVSVTDSNNKTTRYEYDAIGNLLKTIDANGKTTVYTYDTNYQRTSVTDANGNITRYTYNGNLKNMSITLPDGNIIRYEYDAEDRLVKIIDQANNVTTIQYDKGGRVISRHYPDGGVVRYEYDAVGNVIKETNQKGAVITKTYDNLGNVLSVTDNDGNTTRYQYNAMSKVIREENAVSGVTLYEYSPAGDLLSVTDALGNKVVYTYDAYGNKISERDARGNVTTYTYDDNNNLLTVKDALNNITTYTYNSLNQLISEKDARNNVTRYGYDALGRRTTVTDARNNVFTTYYDANGNVIKTTDAKGNTISETVYNCLNLPAVVTDADGKTTTYTYNALGKVESITDSMNRRQVYTYNSRGMTTSVRDALNNLSTAEYDLLGNVTKVTGPRGGSTTYTYDAMGRIISESTTSGGTVSYKYNELNVKKQVTNARGQVIKIFHDALGRITGYITPEDSVSYTYDANGNVLTVTDKNGTVRREYDALNRVVKYTDTFGNVIRYEYDPVGNLKRMIYPDSTAVTYEYDANNNLIKVTDWANRITTYTYDENNRVTGVRKPDGSVTTTVYDNKQRIISTVERTASGTVITGFEYTYDALGRLTEEKVLSNNTKICYEYDSLDRVTKRIIKNSNCVVISEECFTYDAAGNIIGDTSCASFVYDINNRLISYNEQAITYDMDGNMLSAPLNCVTTNFAYDSENRLISAGNNKYTYDAEDVRIKNLCNGKETIYVYNTNAKLSQLLQKTTNGIVTKYVYGLGLIGEETQCSFRTYHFDSRGSTIAITDINGNITDTFEYDTYGKLINRTGNSEIIFGYNGRYGVVTDENGLLYMRARYYSPELRRFVNADIIHGEITNAITLNRYAYANGNPVSYVDPFGLSALGDILKGVAVVGLIVAGTVLTAGTAALPMVMIGGLIGAGVNVGITAYNDLKEDGEFNKSFTEYLAAGVGGFVGGSLGSLVGAVGAPASLAANAFFNGYGSMLGNMAQQYIQKGSIDYVEAICAGLFSGGTTYVIGKIAPAIGNFARKIGSKATSFFSNSADDVARAVNNYTDDAARAVSNYTDDVARAAEGTSKTVTYSPANPGPLKQSVAETFSGATYKETVLTQDTTFYRVYGGSSGKVGSYMTRVPQNGGMQSQVDLALNPQWGNTAQYVTKVTVPKGTVIYEGTAAPQVINGGAGQLIGGGNQVYIPEVDASWFK